MGFVRNRVYKIVFEAADMDGLEVRAKSVPLGQVLKLTKLAGRDLRALDQETQVETIDEMLQMFAAALVSWNVEDEHPDGTRTPVPANFEGLKSQDFDFVMEIVLAWMDALMGVSGPLGKRSPSGDRSLEESLPMETLSPSLPN